ncbi:MAG: hypothetical protein J6K55_06280 [Clostridia bacterium]|nr:hypothetical protein [Clostridia bacterium]
MAESSFSRKIEIRDESSKEKLKQFLESDEPARKLSTPVFSVEERKRSKQLLEQCINRKKHRLSTEDVKIC